MSITDRRDLPNTLTSLSISQPTKRTPAKDAIAENWDDESSSDTETELELPSTANGGPQTGKSTGSSAPPPTPLTPNGESSFESPYSLSAAQAQGQTPLTPMRGNFRPDARYNSGPSGSRSEDGAEERRPEKTTSTAARMIAAGLGVRAPKKTEEMKRYEKAEREKVERRVREEREEKNRAEEAKRAAWED